MSRKSVKAARLRRQRDETLGHPDVATAERVHAAADAAHEKAASAREAQDAEEARQLGVGEAQGHGRPGTGPGSGGDEPF